MKHGILKIFTVAAMMALAWDAAAAWTPPLHCDPWLMPKPGDPTPPPVPIQADGKFQAAYGPCDPPPSSSPSPSPTPVPTPPPSESPEATPPVPSDAPHGSSSPGAFLEGSGKLGCSLNLNADASPFITGILAMGALAPLLFQRRRK
ncbi:MAG: hypothetical protein K8R69_02710 [Deltaproteobacteria bacterium]|nr:hypothetical protein [Deltaproteobacteria bacterium]